MGEEHRDREVEYGRMGRRELLRTWGPPALAAAALAGGGWLLRDRPGRHHAPRPSSAPEPRDWRTQAAGALLAVSRGRGPAGNLRAALEAAGGIRAHVRPGEKVLIKPNCAWDRAPEQAANTDPELVAELVRLCLEAGAAEVIVADNTCHDPVRSFRRSGIGPAAEAAGARVLHQGTAGSAELDLGGSVLGIWRVLRPLAEVNRVFNVPVVKHHSLARATLGMKNWFGVLLGSRPRLHQRIDQSVAELGAALRPTLTIMDATRILRGGGPTGGSLDLVRAEDTVAVATDPTAADAWGAHLLGLDPAQLPFLAISERLGVGSTDWRTILREV